MYVALLNLTSPLFAPYQIMPRMEAMPEEMPSEIY